MTEAARSTSRVSGGSSPRRCSTTRRAAKGRAEGASASPALALAPPARRSCASSSTKKGLPPLRRHTSSTQPDRSPAPSAGSEPGARTGGSRSASSASTARRWSGPRGKVWARRVRPTRVASLAASWLRRVATIRIASADSSEARKRSSSTLAESAQWMSSIARTRPRLRATAPRLRATRAKSSKRSDGNREPVASREAATRRASRRTPSSSPAGSGSSSEPIRSSITRCQGQ